MRVHWGTGLKYGALLGAFFAVLVLATVYFEPGVMLDDYPEPIQQRAALSAAPPAWLEPVLAVALWGGCLAILFVANREINRRHAFRFRNTAATFGVAFAVLGLTDIVIVDWLVFATLTPDFMVIPGTEGMAEYQDYGFHLEPAQLVGIPLLVVLSLLGAAVFNVSRLRAGDAATASP
jgi:hypothetical protein